MRITNQYVTSTMIRHMQNNLGRLMGTEEQMATLRRVNRPSDDPAILSPLLAVKGNLSYNVQYDRNLGDGIAYLDVADSTLQTVGKVIVNAYEYAKQAANDTYTADQRKASAMQIDKYIDEIVEMGNAAVGSKYIFAGTNNGNPPFKRVKGDDGIEYIIFKGNTDDVLREVAAHSSYPISEPGVSFGDPPAPVPEGVFGYAKDGSMKTITVAGKPIEGQVIYADTYPPPPDSDFTGIFKDLFALRNRLNDDTNPDQQGEIDKSVEELLKAQDRTLQYDVKVGSRYNQFKDMKNELLSQNNSLEGTESLLEDADLEKLSIVWTQQKLAREASLAVGAGLLKTTLLDFLR